MTTTTIDQLIREAPAWDGKRLKLADVAEAARRMDACFNLASPVRESFASAASGSPRGASLWAARQIYRAALVRGLGGLPMRSVVVDGDTIYLDRGGEAITRESINAINRRYDATERAKRKRGVA